MQETSAAPAAAAAVRSTRARFTVLGLMTFGTMCNYLDRAVLGVAAPAMSSDLALDPVKMGILFSAFSWTYALAQMPGGAFLDRIGTRLAYFWSVTLWSLFTLFQGLASGLASAPRLSARPRYRRSALLPSQQPHSQRMVSSARARARDRGVFGRPVRRARLPEPAALLDRRAPRLARPVRDCRRRGSAVRAGVVAPVPRAARERARQRAGAAEDSRRWRARPVGPGGSVRVAEHRRAAQAPADPRRIDRAVRRQLHARVLSHLVSDLPCDRARDGSGSRSASTPCCPSLPLRSGVLCGGWVSDTLLKRTGSATLARKLPILTGLLLASDHRRCELRRQQRRRHRRHVRRVLRAGNGESRLDAHHRRRAAARSSASRAACSTCSPISPASSRRSSSA